jgi:hypothetical protein
MARQLHQVRECQAWRGVDNHLSAAALPAEHQRGGWEVHLPLARQYGSCRRPIRRRATVVCQVAPGIAGDCAVAADLERQHGSAGLGQSLPCRDHKGQRDDPREIQHRFDSRSGSLPGRQGGSVRAQMRLAILIRKSHDIGRRVSTWLPRSCYNRVGDRSHSVSKASHRHADIQTETQWETSRGHRNESMSPQRAFAS